MCDTTKYSGKLKNIAATKLPSCGGAGEGFSINTIKDAHWYNVQEGDARMFPIASSEPGQKIKRNPVYKK